MYADQYAQQLYDKAHTCKSYASKSSGDIRKTWIEAATLFEEAAQTLQEARDIEKETIQRFEEMKPEALKTLKDIIESDPNLPEGLQKAITEFQHIFCE